MIEPYIYVVLSHTTTRVGKIVRMATGEFYNHAAISFDRNLEEMYAFACPQYHTPALGRLVHETTGMYTRDGQVKDVPVRVYAIPVTPGERDKLKSDLLAMSAANNCLYNFPSAVSFPFLHGVKSDRMYTCCEFVAWCLGRTSVKLEKPAYNYGPSELLAAIDDYCVFEGHILDFAVLTSAPKGFFDNPSPILIGASVLALGTVAFRVARSAARQIVRVPEER